MPAEGTGSGHPAVAGGAGVPAAELHLRAGLPDRGQRRPGVARRRLAVARRLLAWSAACAIAYLHGFGRRPAWVVAEIVVVVGADTVHRAGRIRSVGAGQPVLADHAVGDQRDDLGGDPVRPRSRACSPVWW